MDKFDIIGQLYRKAKANGWAFCAGDDFYQNIAATQETMTDGQLVLTAQFNCTPTLSQNDSYFQWYIDKNIGTSAIVTPFSSKYIPSLTRPKENSTNGFKL